MRSSKAARLRSAGNHPASGARKPFIVCDRNTYRAAGQRVEAMIGEMQLPYTLYCFPTDQIIEPDEFAVGQVCSPMIRPAI
jgi:hypothetical protein